MSRMGMDERLSALDSANRPQMTFEELQNLPTIPKDTKAPKTRSRSEFIQATGWSLAIHQKIRRDSGLDF